MVFCLGAQYLWLSEPSVGFGGIIMFLRHIRVDCIALFAVGLLAAGCSNPGLKLQEEGSEVWAGREASGESVGRLSANEAYRVTLQDITPALVRGMRSEARSDEVPSVPRGPGDGAGPSEYRIGPGDVINVVVWNHPELTSPMGPGISQSPEDAGRLVRADGTVFYPFVGVTKVAGMTVEEVRAQFEAKLKKVLTDPQVDVRVVAYRSQRIVVTSDLGTSCIVPVTDKPVTVLDALGQCSVTNPTGAAQGAVYYTTAILTRGERSQTLDLAALYRGGGTEAGTLVLKDGDRLHFVDNRAQRVFMLGEVKDQVALTMPVKGMSLADALADAGGLKLDTANAGRIYVIRGFVDEVQNPDGSLHTRLEPVIYQLNARSVDALLLADQFPLKPRDVVFVSSATLVNWNRALAQIIPSLNAIFQTAVIIDRVDNN
jgi:polysaccharide export outer membrane protein